MTIVNVFLLRFSNIPQMLTSCRIFNHLGNELIRSRNFNHVDTKVLVAVLSELVPWHSDTLTKEPLFPLFRFTGFCVKSLTDVSQTLNHFDYEFRLTSRSVGMKF